MSEKSSSDLSWDDWDQGFEAGLAASRAEAFAAIRRAAEVARIYDQDAMLSELHFCEGHARAIRQAIRAAIGSEKS